MTERKTPYVTKVPEPPPPAAEVRFAVGGNPVPKARPRVVVHASGQAHAFTPQRTRAWENLVSRAACLAMAGRAPLEGPVAVELRFYRRTAHRADGDNLEKSALDAMNGIVFLDDAQVVECHRYKALDRERPRVEVRVWERG